MADEPWFFERVVQDKGSADDAVHSLSYAAMGLGEALALLEADIPTVVEDGRGKARMVFDEQMPGILTAGHQLVAVLLTAAVSVGAAHESAALEEGLRASLRAAHYEELARSDPRSRADAPV